MVQVDPQKEEKTAGAIINSPTLIKPEAKQPESPPLPETGKKKPAIRTMKSDIDELLKNSRLTVSNIVSSTNQFSAVSVRSAQIKKIILIAVTLLVLSSLSFYIYSLVKSGRATTPTISKPAVPPPFFATEASRTITVNEGDRLRLFNLLTDSVQEQEVYGSVKRIIIKIVSSDGRERFATLADFLDYYRINPPPNFVHFIGGPLMLFIYYSPSGSRLGLATKVIDSDRAALSMFSWEPSLVSDFRPFFFGTEFGEAASPFEDRTYRNIDWRFLKSSKNTDLGTGYVIFPARDVLIISTSREGMGVAIDRLFEAK